MKITKRQLRRIIKEAMSSSYAGRYRDVSSHGGPAGRGTPVSVPQHKKGRGGFNTDLESEVRSAYRSGRSTPQGIQIQGIVDELYMMRDEPENFSMEKDKFIQSHERYSPDVPREQVEFLWNYYMTLGKSL